MHLCLSCNQPCDISSVFCDVCRLSLLERGAEEQQESAASIEKREAEGVEGLVDLAVPLYEGSKSVPLRMTEERRVRLWGSGTQRAVGTLEEEEKEAEVDVNATVPAEAQATSVLTATNPSLRRRMPARMHRVLLIFCVIGLLALIVDSVLLTLSIIRHRASSTGAVSSITTAPTLGHLTSGSSATSGSARTAFTLSSTHLFFTATQGQGDPPPQIVTLLAGQAQPFSWAMEPASSLPTWLHLSSAQGHTSGSAGTQVSVSALATRLSPGTYTSGLLVNVFDEQGHALPGSPQTLTVLLTVQIPCVLSVTPGKLSFAAVLLSPPAPQTLNITERGNCARPITWQASADVPWITFSSSSGVDTGAGSTITVQASSSGKLIGSYTAHVTLQVSNARGLPLADAPFTITVTLTVIA